jgi:hypothetical protein
MPNPVRLAMIERQEQQNKTKKWSLHSQLWWIFERKLFYLSFFFLECDESYNRMAPIAIFLFRCRLNTLDYMHYICVALLISFFFYFSRQFCKESNVMAMMESEG